MESRTKGVVLRKLWADVRSDIQTECHFRTVHIRLLYFRNYGQKVRSEGADVTRPLLGATAQTKRVGLCAVLARLGVCQLSLGYFPGVPFFEQTQDFFVRQSVTP